jgi:tRNA (cmo5U34)-methyltransferase
MKQIGRYEMIREHFEKEAAVFDRLFFKVMPYYEEMMTAVVDSLPFAKGGKLSFCDLGCGTANLTLKLLAGFPRSRVSCVDMAERMIEAAKLKTAGYGPRVSFWQGDIRDFRYGSYDAVVSSLVLHHLEKKEKPAFYRKLLRALKPGGVFFNIDIFLSPDPHLQSLFMAQWRGHMRKNGLPMGKVNEMIRRHQREDRPVEFGEELEMMARAGFRDIDAVVKKYNFAVYGGTKG